MLFVCLAFILSYYFAWALHTVLNRNDDGTYPFPFMNLRESFQRYGIKCEVYHGV